uniref:Uncharacterized protein n=1 Tax=Rhizophora mucronata TaxID=61149 RepID=A0A2P2PVG1_RHIMU
MELNRALTGTKTTVLSLVQASGRNCRVKNSSC